jgi:hypothetical protein
MPAWNVAEAIVDSVSLTAGDPVDADVQQIPAPIVCVELEDLEGAADDTLTVRFDGGVATYTAHEETLAETASVTVEVPRTNRVEIESSGGVTYSAEVRSRSD